MNVKQIVLTGVVLGMVCAGVVWYLERFESARLFHEMREYMTRHDKFREWLDTEEGKG